MEYVCNEPHNVAAFDLVSKKAGVFSPSHSVIYDQQKKYTDEM